MRKYRMLDDLSVLQERFANGMGWQDGDYAEALDEAIELLNNMPSADVVEIVRCKDCKFWEPLQEFDLLAAYDKGKTIGACRFNDNKDHIAAMWENDFCSYGERKETE